MAIIGIGNDLVEICRIAQAVDRHGERFAERILSAAELALYRESSRPDIYLAKCFALKEAVSKALGSGMSKGVAWSDIESDRQASGQPVVRLSGGAAYRLEELGGRCVHVTLSDDAGLVFAVAIAE